MAENDIYNSKVKYDSFKKTYLNFATKPNSDESGHKGKRQYYCKNSTNLAYFDALFAKFEAKDTSYVRRLRLLNTYKLVCFSIDKDLRSCDRTDIDTIVAFMHNRYNSPKSKRDFIRDIKYLWKILFPEKDEKERIDETITPYPVRHLDAKQDRSREKLRNDKLTLKEFDDLISYFSNDPRLQAYLYLALESLARPQELLYTKIKDFELFDNYAKVYISEHGKEGTGLLQCIDSYPYVLKWYQMHPFKHNKNSFFFINIGAKNRIEQLRPENINKLLTNACKDLDITKSITCYSIKRNGVTFRRLRGDSDMEIQHAARWKSNKQLKTYDMSSQEDALKIELAKRGMIKDEKYSHFQPKSKKCPICDKPVGINEEICPFCKHIVDREKVKEQIEDHSHVQKEIAELKGQVSELLDYKESWKRLFQILPELHKLIEKK